MMNAKQYLALAAWNLYPLTQEPPVIAFLCANNGAEILNDLTALLQNCYSGKNGESEAKALIEQLIDYTWAKTEDENGEQGALELLSGAERLCNDIRLKRQKSLPYAEAALNYRIDFLGETDAACAENCRTLLRSARENAAKHSPGRELSAQHRELLALLIAENPPA